MKSEKFLALGKRVESFFGKKILSYKDCLELQQDIFTKTETLLSINTLRRYFGLIKNEHTPSLTTLHTLARYCGYSSFSELPDQATETSGSADPALLQYMVSLFRDTPVIGENDKTFFNLVRLTTRFLNSHPAMALPFQQAIAKTKNGQTYYYELFVNMDRLNGYYGDGLLFYLREKTDTEAEIFGITLLALRHWLSNDMVRFQQFSQKAIAIPLPLTLPPAVCGRYFGVRVLQAKQQKKSLGGIYNEARNFYEDLVAANNHNSSTGFKLTFTEALILAGEWQEALFYSEIALRKLKKNPPLENGADLTQTFYLFHASALAQVGKEKTAIALLEKVDATRFDFLSKRFYTILYLLTERKLHLGNRVLQLQHLLNETQFYRLNREVSSNAPFKTKQPVPQLQEVGRTTL